MKSIRARLNVGLAVSLVAVFVILGIGVSVSFRVLAERYILSRLEHDAESLLTSLMQRPHGAPLGLRADRLNPIYQHAFSGHYYRIETDGMVLRSRSLWDQDLHVPSIAPGDVLSMRIDGPEQQWLLMRVAAYRKFEQTVTIAVAEDLSPIRTEVRSFQLRYAVFALFALTALLLLQRHILRRGLAPMTDTRNELQALARGERQKLSEQVPEEVLPLVQGINRLLMTLQQRLQRSRNAVGNLAHALKTPLTLLGQIADRDDYFRDTATADQARALVEKVRLLTERELKRARLAGAATGGERLDLGTELDALAGVLRQIYHDRAVRIDVEHPAALVLAADREDMRELFGNLLDNACKWARSRVRVQADATGAGVRVRIEDDGPGRDAAELERLNQRGVRIDEDSAPGHGLGLAIVQDILDDYGACLSLGRSESLGGFSAEVMLRPTA